MTSGGAGASASSLRHPLPRGHCTDGRELDDFGADVLAVIHRRDPHCRLCAGLDRFVVDLLLAIPSGCGHGARLGQHGPDVGRQLALGDHDGRLRRGLGVGRKLGFRPADRGIQFRGIGGDAARVLECSDPVPEIRLRDLDHSERRGRDRALLLEQPVVDLLDGPGELAELREADHPATAFQRVKLPARRAQRLAIARVPLELAAIGRDGVEHLSGLDEVDFQQLGIESLGIDREQSLRLRRNGRSRRRTPRRRCRRSPKRQLPARPCRRSRAPRAPPVPARRAPHRRSAWHRRRDRSTSRPARRAPPASAGARRISATSSGNVLRRSSTASSTVSAARSSSSAGASPSRLASSGAISRCRFGRCCSNASTKNPSPASDSARSSRSSSSTAVSGFA